MSAYLKYGLVAAAAIAFYLILGVVAGSIFVGLAVLYFVTEWLSRRPLWTYDPSSRAAREMEHRPPDFVTPGGVEVWYLPDVPAKDISLEEIDRGVDFAFKKTRCAYPNIPIDRSAHRIKIAVFPSEKAPESGAWSMRIPIMNGFPYWNSEWDLMKGIKARWHYILAAEFWLATGEPYGDEFALPYVPPSEADKNYVARACSYAMEHQLLAWYDPAKYEATKIHGDGQGHPLIPACPGDTEL